MAVFSKRNRPQPASYRYDVPSEVRSRILHAVRQHCESYDSHTDFISLLNEVGEQLLVEYGSLLAPGFEAARVSDNPVIEHFFSCDDEMVLDFLELLFRPFRNLGQPGVDAINAVLQDAAVGYELTPYVQTVSDEPGTLFGRPAGKKLDITYPKAIRRDSQYLHSEATQPALSLLSDGRYQGANEEFLSAHEHYRHGRYKECLNECLKAFESTMKTICDEKGWPYNPTDTAKTLIQTCLDNGLVPSFSQSQLTSLRTSLESGIPTVRNKRSGHGQGAQVTNVPPELARYALNLTGTTIVLLIESATA